MGGYTVLDLETVVDDSVWVAPPPKYEVEPGTPGSFGGPALKAVEPFPPAHACRIVACAMVHLSDVDGRFYHYVGHEVQSHWDHELPDLTECALLANVVASFEQRKPLFVSWNGRTFDMPVLNMRSLKHGLPASWYYRDKDIRYRYSEVGHCDLMDVFSDYGAARSMKLDEVAKLIGLPGKTGDVAGNSVGRFYSQGDSSDLMSKVGHYCLQDTFQTAVLFIRSRYHKGMLDKKQYNAAIESFTPALFKQVLGEEFDYNVLLVK